MKFVAAAIVLVSLSGCSHKTSAPVAPLQASLSYIESHFADGTKQLPTQQLSEGFFKGSTLHTYRSTDQYGQIWENQVIERDGQVLAYTQKFPKAMFRLARSPSEILKTMEITMGGVYAMAHELNDKEGKAGSPEAKNMSECFDFANQEASTVFNGGSASRVIGDSGMRYRSDPQNLVIDIFSQPTYLALKQSELAAKQ